MCVILFWNAPAVTLARRKKAGIFLSITRLLLIRYHHAISYDEQDKATLYLEALSSRHGEREHQALSIPRKAP